MTAVPTSHGFRHEAAIFHTDDELVELAVPFLQDGIAAGEPTVVGLDHRERRVVFDALDDVGALTSLAWDEVFANPFVALERNRSMFRDILDGGTSRVRLLGQVPGHGARHAWDRWSRYEAALNHLYGGLDAWTVCPYDARTTPDDVLADVERTHTHLRVPGDAHHPSAAYTDPAAFLAQRALDEADPLEATHPGVAGRDPTPAQARRMVAALAAGTALDRATVQRFTLAVSEVVTNATTYGTEPVDVRGWAVPDRMVMTVQDYGPGPGDPFIGLVPRRDGPGGLGLWMAYQACSRMALLSEPDCFTVRMTAGHPPDVTG